MGKEIAACCKPITSMFASQSDGARMEIRMCTFVIEKNLPLSMPEDMLNLMKSLFPTNDTLKEVTLGKQKSTNVIRQVLGFYSLK